MLRLQAAIANLQVTQAQWLHELESRAAFAAAGERDAATWLAVNGQTTKTAAKKQAELGRAMDLEPVLADAVAAGDISPDTAHALVPALSSDHSGDVADLIDVCRGATPGEARAAGSQFQLLNPPVGSTPKEREHALRERRGLRFADNGDGTTDVSGTLTTADACGVQKALKSLITKPTPGDDRTYEQKLADSLVQLCDAYARGQVRGGRGNLPTVLLTIGIDDLTNNTGYGTASTGELFSAEQVRQMTSNAHVQRVLLADSVVLDEGRRVRLATDEQWRALVARDGGCRFGCDLPPEWCQTDHILEWDADHGPSDIHWLILLCSYHHHYRHRPDVHLHGDANNLTVELPDGRIVPLPARGPTLRKETPAA